MTCVHTKVVMCEKTYIVQFNPLYVGMQIYVGMQNNVFSIVTCIQTDKRLKSVSGHTKTTYIWLSDSGPYNLIGLNFVSLWRQQHPLDCNPVS